MNILSFFDYLFMLRTCLRLVPQLLRCKKAKGTQVCNLRQVKQVRAKRFAVCKPAHYYCSDVFCTSCGEGVRSGAMVKSLRVGLKVTGLSGNTFSIVPSPSSVVTSP